MDAGNTHNQQKEIERLSEDRIGLKESSRSTATSRINNLKVNKVVPDYPLTLGPFTRRDQ